MSFDAMHHTRAFPDAPGNQTGARGVTRYLHRFGRATALLGLCVWVTGSLASFYVGDASMFQRFGSLGSAVAVLLFTDRLTRIELSRQRTVERLLHEFGVEMEQLKAGADPRDIPRRGYVIDFLTEERKFDQLRGSAGRWGMLNTALLTLATLQWGFGDLFFLAYLQ
ncbi:hypothetical protein [Tropicimonas sp. IMCC34043]|uniref:hypothetical protein n=1 Tax=Tropicimonas sp. IMCC34043 TaxID=2248760 RepID=UPI000E262917|nr:hypothetical protein [Tropicimonas sp. IMCC34043]